MSSASRQRSAAWAALGSRWLGVGTASAVSVLVLGLALTGQLTLYVAPETVWFGAAAAVVTLIGAIWSCTLPLGAEEHDHDHGHDHDHDHGRGRGVRRVLSGAGTVTAGVLVTGILGVALLLPAATLSPELAMERAEEETPLFAGADTVSFGIADTARFGVGDWATVFSRATHPEAYDGSPLSLTGFVTRTESGASVLTRMVITHCVIDARTATLPLDALDSLPVGQWVSVHGAVRVAGDGALRIEPTEITAIAQPKDPYEH